MARDGMTRAGAEILGLQAIAWLAADPDGMERFLAQSGIEPAALRAAADNPETLAAILDFMLLNEALLLRFCEDGSMPATDLHIAKHILNR